MRKDSETPNQDFKQAIAIQLVNGIVITVSYIGPQSKPQTTTKFLSETLSRHGTNQIIVGDLNARHVKWETTVQRYD